MAIKIIRAGMSNLQQVTQLFDNYRTWYHQRSDVQAAEFFLSERLRGNDSVIFLALIDDQPAGFTQLYSIFSSVQMGKAWLLNDLYVAEFARKQGVATMLLNVAKHHGIETAARFLMLQTGPENTWAQKLYTKNDWVRSGDFIYELSLVNKVG